MKLTDLSVSRTIHATPEEIFDVWMDPQVPGGPWFGAERAIINPVVGGLFYHAVQHEGRTWAHYGRFIRIERPQLVEHTWVSEATQGVESIVTVTLQGCDDRTEITLHHSGVPDDEMGRRHAEGWGWLLSMLAQRFEARSEQSSPHVG